MTTKNSILPVHPALGGLDRTTDSTVLDPNFLLSRLITWNTWKTDGGKSALA